MKQYVTAKEAIFLTEHAIDRMRNSDEYKEIMDELNEKLLKAAEAGFEELIVNFDDIPIPKKYNQKMFIENLAEDWKELGFETTVFFMPEEKEMTISWKY